MHLSGKHHASRVQTSLDGRSIALDVLWIVSNTEAGIQALERRAAASVLAGEHPMAQIRMPVHLVELKKGQPVIAVANHL